MSKKIILLLLILLSHTAIFCKQNDEELTFDKGLGSLKSLRIGSTAIELILKNDLPGLLSLYKDTSGINLNYLKSELEKNSKAYPFSEIHFPPSYTSKSETNFYYERNFCKKQEDNIQYELQIHVILQKIDTSFYVKQIQFRRKNEIEKRSTETKNLIQVSKDESLRPPPPTPPPIRLPMK
jgi:hypothetical protein